MVLVAEAFLLGKESNQSQQQEINKDKINVPLEKDKSISSIQKPVPNADTNDYVNDVTEAMNIKEEEEWH